MVLLSRYKVIVESHVCTLDSYHDKKNFSNKKNEGKALQKKKFLNSRDSCLKQLVKSFPNHFYERKDYLLSCLNHYPGTVSCIGM